MRKDGIINGFSIELRSKKYMKNVLITNSLHEKVLFEGDLGNLKDIRFIEGVVLILNGTKGILRVELSEAKMREMISRDKMRQNNTRILSSEN